MQPTAKTSIANTIALLSSGTNTDGRRRGCDWIVGQSPSRRQMSGTAIKTNSVKARGISRAQVALAWVLAKPGITAPIVGATKPHHLDDAIAAVDVKLSPEEIESLEKLYVPRPVVGF